MKSCKEVHATPHSLTNLLEGLRPGIEVHESQDWPILQHRDRESVDGSNENVTVLICRVC